MRARALTSADARYLLASRRREGNQRALINRVTEPVQVEKRTVQSPVLVGVPAYARNIYPGYFSRIADAAELQTTFLEWGEYGQRSWERFLAQTDLSLLMRVVAEMRNYGFFALRDDEGELESLHCLYPNQGDTESKLILHRVGSPRSLMPDDYAELMGGEDEINPLDRTLYVDLAVLIHSIWALVFDAEAELTPETAVEINLGIVAMGRLKPFHSELLFNDGYQAGLLLECLTLLRERVLPMKPEQLGQISRGGIFRGLPVQQVYFYGLKIEADLAIEILTSYSEKISQVLPLLSRAKEIH